MTELLTETTTDNDKQTTLADAMVECLHCCQLYGVYLGISKGMTEADIGLKTPAFVDILSDRDLETLKGNRESYDQEIPILRAEECHASYSNFFFPKSEAEAETEAETDSDDDDDETDTEADQFVPTEEQLTAWQQQLFGQLSGRIKAIFDHN